MEISIRALSFAPAMLVAALMGFAIQRGNTCTVAAVDQVLGERRWQRFRSIIEAAAWVLGGLLLARACGISSALPPGYAISGLTVAGGALLGLGAFVNRACAFGAIARLGSGESSYLVSPVGFYVGCRAAGVAMHGLVPRTVAFTEPSAAVTAALALALAALLTWRSVAGIFRGGRGVATARNARVWRALSRDVWQPAGATAVIGVAFVAMWLLVGPWAYTDGLAELSRGARMSVVARTALLLALLAGALYGGWSAGRWRRVAPAPAALLRCLCGGALMGAGSCLIPGGNDGLLLVGMPLLWPYAWTAFAAMVASIALALMARGEARGLKQARGST